MSTEEHPGPKNPLQKTCYREFRKWFPELVKRIELADPNVNLEIFRFSIPSDSPEFGKIEIEIDHQEITVYTDFYHQHFGVYYFDDKDDNIRQLKATDEALTFVKDLIEGNIFFELKRKDKQIINSFIHYKDYPEEVSGALVYFKSDTKSDASDPNIPTERILVDWNGVIQREIISETNIESKVNPEDSIKSLSKSKVNFWTKLKSWF